MLLARLRSIQATLLLWVGMSMFLLAAILITYAAVSMRRTVIDQAEEQAAATTRVQIATVKETFDQARVTTRTLGQTFAGVVDETHRVTLSRDDANGLFARVLSDNPQYVDAWSLWEPNAFDGRDALFAGKLPYDQTGRYNVYFGRSASGAIDIAANTGYEDGTADWYAVPRTTKRPYITEPYRYELLGEEILVTSIIQPVVVDNQYYGQVAVDIEATFLQRLADDLALYNNTGRLILFSGTGKLMGVTQRAEVIGQDLLSVYPSLNANGELERVRRGEEVVTYQGDQLVILMPVIVPGMAEPWGAALTIPLQQITAEADQVMWWMIGVGCMLTLVALAVLWFVSRQIVRPIRRLTSVVDVIASGDLDQQADQSDRNEVGQLATAFNQMTANLRAARATERQARETEQQLRVTEARGREQLEQAVRAYLSFTQHVASGDLTQRVDVGTGGVLSQLDQGLNAMVESLQRMTSQVQEATTAMAAAAAEILAATTQQAASAAEQSAALSQTNTTIDEVKAIALQTAQQAAQVAQDSQSALGAARQGTHAVEETVSSMGQIRARVESIAQTILALAEQTQAIATITATVSELADQSNLLALNAAIEAARAGEQGKSFAVVAQHVRELAERSKGATVQVREILSEIQKATHAAVLVTEEGTKGVEAGAQLASKAGQVIHRIAGEVEGGAQANVQMASAAQQQTAGMEQIGQAMGSIQQATAQTLASTRQAERAAQDLNALAQSLQRTIAAYQL